jgi:hypothetical protein
MSGPGAPPSQGGSSTRPQGPGASGGAAAPGSNPAADMESALAHAAEQNIQYLQLQEAVNAQNRHFSVLSNVMKSEHDTVKNAIGNLR